MNHILCFIFTSRLSCRLDCWRPRISLNIIEMTIQSFFQWLVSHFLGLCCMLATILYRLGEWGALFYQCTILNDDDFDCSIGDGHPIGIWCMRFKFDCTLTGWYWRWSPYWHRRWVWQGALPGQGKPLFWARERDMGSS